MKAKPKVVSGAAEFSRTTRLVCKRCSAPLEPTPSGFLTCPSGDRGLITLQAIVNPTCDKVELWSDHVGRQDEDAKRRSSGLPRRA